MHARIEPAHSRRQHRGVQMAAAAGINLDHAAASLFDTFGIARRFLISLDHEYGNFLVQIENRPFQQRCFARVGRAHQIDRRDPAALEPTTIPLGKKIVLCKYLLFEMKRAGCRGFVTMRVIMVMRMVVSANGTIAGVAGMRTMSGRIGLGGIASMIMKINRRWRTVSGLDSGSRPTSLKRTSVSRAEQPHVLHIAKLHFPDFKFLAP
jgi:hypothetical protein